MKSLLLYSLIFFTSFTVISCKENEKKENLVLVQVDDQSLRAKEFANQLAVKLRGYDALSVKNQATLNRVKEEVIKDFVVKVLTEKWAQEKGIQISDDNVKEEVQRIRSQYPDDISFRRNLASEHVSFDQWKEDLRYTLLQKKVLGAIVESSSAEFTDEELKNYYNENSHRFAHPKLIKVQQVVVKKKENAEKIMKDLKSSTELGDLARKYSIAPESQNDGITDWIAVDTLDIFQKAYALPPGKVKLMKSPFGYHILKVVDKKEDGRDSFDEVKNRIKNSLRQDSEQKLFTAWLDQQLRRYKVLRNNELIASIFVETKEN